jgi:hypothetical protein
MKPMKFHEYREKLDALGLTQIAAAQFLGIAERTSRRYAPLALIAITRCTRIRPGPASPAPPPSSTT